MRSQSELPMVKLAEVLTAPGGRKTKDAFVWGLATWWRARDRWSTDKPPFSAGIAKLADLSPADFELAAAGWCTEGHLDAHLCARPAKHLGDEELLQLHIDLEQMADVAAQATAAELAWRRLVQAGATVREAWHWVSNWPNAADALPTGQWVKRDWQGDAQRGMVKLAHGIVLPRHVAVSVQAHMRAGQKINAIKLVRKHAACGLRDAKEAVESSDGLPMVDAAAPPSEPFPLAVDQLLAEFPLHWLVLSATRYVATQTVPTMAIGAGIDEFVLFYNLDFVAEISQDQCMGVLLHEINHVLLGHLQGYGTALGPKPTPHDRKAWTIACEVTANEFINLPLPGSPLLLSQFGLPPLQSTLQRCEELRKRPDLPQVGVDFLDITLAHGATSIDQCSTLSQGTVRMLQELLEMLGEELPAATQTLLASGTLGETLSVFEPPGIARLPWPQLLALAIRGLSGRQSTRRFPARRAPERVGVVPGRRRQREPLAVLVAIDTSGSMTDWDLREILDELHAIRQQGLRVALVQCDTEVRAHGWLAPDTAVTKLKGRGCTDLCPPFAPQLLAQYRPGIVVYFTDGGGTAPAQAPPEVTVLWVLTGDRPVRPARWGQVATLRPRGQRSGIRDGF